MTVEVRVKQVGTVEYTVYDEVVENVRNENEALMKLLKDGKLNLTDGDIIEIEVLDYSKIKLEIVQP